MRIIVLCGLLCGCSVFDGSSSGNSYHSNQIYVGSSYIELSRFDDLDRYACRVGALVCDPTGASMVCSCGTVDW